MPRLSDMTLRELSEIGQRVFEAKGLLAGEDPSLLEDDECAAEFIEDDDLYNDLRERWLANE